MSRAGMLVDGVVYPTSDGRPMAETELHAQCMVYVASALRLWFKRNGRDDVYVGSNNFLYYEKGNPRAAVAPDVYVVVGAPAGLRDTYLLWNEPKGPDFVLEVTSKSTRGEDEGRKRTLYAALGVSEYFLYDPRAEWLAPPLQGWRLDEGRYRPRPAVTVLPSRAAAVTSEVLGFELRDERDARGERRLRLRDLATGETLRTHEEAEARIAEEAAAHGRETEARARPRPAPPKSPPPAGARRKPAAPPRRGPQSSRPACRHSKPPRTRPKRRSRRSARTRTIVAQAEPRRAGAPRPRRDTDQDGATPAPSRKAPPPGEGLRSGEERPLLPGRGKQAGTPTAVPLEAALGRRWRNEGGTPTPPAPDSDDGRVRRRFR